ncbi:right-handed parallel beta-helix repeat-containing protein [Cellulomonas soli]|uniref:right-handed parallel beta-helix repeat-containing protein n=1 Tax=Cellulomonas soli TaxID=931535 RepID=UPI003F854152
MSLTPSGGIRVTEPGRVIEGLDVDGDISIEAPGVVIRNSRIHGDGTYGVYVRSGSVTITDTEIFGFENAIAGSSWTATRVDIHSTYGDGVKLGSDVVLEDSWIHDMTPAPGAHADGAQMQSGVENLTIRRNVIDMTTAGGANSALFLAPDLGPSTRGPVLVEQNVLDGGHYTLFCVDGNDGQYVVENITIRSNEFGRGADYGAARVNVPVTWVGNVYSDGSAARY